MEFGRISVEFASHWRSSRKNKTNDNGKKDRRSEEGGGEELAGSNIHAINTQKKKPTISFFFLPLFTKIKSDSRWPDGNA